MNFILHPWHLLVMILADWTNAEQQRIIDFYRAQLEAVMAAQGKIFLFLATKVTARAAAW